MMGLSSGFPNVCLAPSHAAPAALPGAAARPAGDPAQLRSRLGILHGELASMVGTDPARWHARLGESRADELTMRLFFPAELDALLALEGFEIEAKYGDYDRRPFDAASSKQLIVCRLRGSTRGRSPCPSTWTGRARRTRR